jgi:hypothetical protein
MVPHFLCLKDHSELLRYLGKLQWYLSLPPWFNVIKLFTMVLYFHAMVIATVILFYNTELQQYHGMAPNYYSKKVSKHWPLAFNRAYNEFIHTV